MYRPNGCYSVQEIFLLESIAHQTKLSEQIHAARPCGSAFVFRRTTSAFNIVLSVILPSNVPVSNHAEGASREGLPTWEPESNDISQQQQQQQHLLAFP